MKRRSALLAATALAAALAAGFTPAQAQGDKPVTLVVPYAPAGTTDMLGRLVAQNLGPALQRTVVVENKPGAGTAIGAAQVARAPADGSTLLVATSTTLAINSSLYKKLNYDPATDFAPIGLVASVPLVMVVPASLNVKSLAELTALARGKSDGLLYGSAGNGSPQHLAGEMFKSATGMNLRHVPYKGSAVALTDLLGGQIDVMFIDIAPALGHIRSGKLRALAVTSARRQPTLPDVAPIADSGLPGTQGFEAVAWQSIVAPAGTPRDTVARLSQELARIMARPEVRERLERDGVEPRTSTPEQLAAYIRSETDRWSKVVKASGATVE